MFAKIILILFLIQIRPNVYGFVLADEANGIPPVDCIDQVPASTCEAYKNAGYCSFFPKICALTCNPACANTSVTTTSPSIAVTTTSPSIADTTTSPSIDCIDVAPTSTCYAYKMHGYCSFFPKICAFTCDPACANITTTVTPSTSSGPSTVMTTLAPCSPSPHRGSNTCCDRADNCTQMTDNGDVTVCNYARGKYYPNCAYTCNDCNTPNDPDSGVDVKKVCGDNYDTVGVCLPLKQHGFCSLIIAQQYCWATCASCKYDVPVSASLDQTQRF